MNDLLTLSSLAIREMKSILLIGDRNFFPCHKRQSLAQFLPQYQIKGFVIQIFKYTPAILKRAKEKQAYNKGSKLVVIDIYQQPTMHSAFILNTCCSLVKYLHYLTLVTFLHYLTKMKLKLKLSFDILVKIGLLDIFLTGYYLSKIGCQRKVTNIV